MSCKIIFVRHGQSVGNKDRVYLGHTDLDLSELGYAQAECVGGFLKDRKIDKIYCSDLMRAYHTSLPLAKNLGINPEKQANLREIFAGEWENKNYDYLISNYPDSYGIWQNDIGLSCPDGGESVTELQKRIVDAVAEIAKENDRKTVAVFTHATPIRSFFAYVRGLTAATIKDVPWATNASISEVEFCDGVFEEICYSEDAFMGNLTSSFSNGV